MSDPGQEWISAMRAGAFDRAWAISAQVLARRDPGQRDDPTLPYHLRWVWDGRPFDGRDVLVRCYHGLGDTLQFARFLPLLAKRARSVAVEVHPRLIPLLRSIADIERFLPFDPARPAPPSACDLEITELPFALRASPDVVATPYLRASPAALPAGTIGLCYSAGEWDVARCVPPALLNSLCAGRSVFSLVAEPTDLPVLNPDGCPFDIGTTASLVAGLDLVVTVDTMIAHLAGALDRPTWLLLKAAPDWRWPEHGRATPWSPSMRLYHQPRPGDWSSVVAHVAEDLEREAVSPRGQERL